MRAARARMMTSLLAAVGVLSGLPAEAGRSLVVDDAEPVDPGRVQLEVGLELTRAPGSTTLALPLGLAAAWRSAWPPPAGLFVTHDSTSPRHAAGAGDVDQ